MDSRFNNFQLDLSERAAVPRSLNFDIAFKSAKKLKDYLWTVIHNEKTNRTLYYRLVEAGFNRLVLIKEGFDDVTVLVELMKGKKGISDIDLKNIGILFAGDRARILIKLQLDACENEFKFNNFLNENSIFYVTNHSEKDYKKDNYLKELYKWLQNIKLQNLFSNFYQQGYFSVDLLLIQMLIFF